jgi:three-Cys-motif partner protein
MREQTMGRDDPGGFVHRFGGDWTEAKLNVLRGYLSAYTTALKNTPFSLGYIDAFAGSGTRVAKQPADAEGSSQLVFPDLAAPEPEELLDGSARIALRTAPPFNGYVFIERDPARCDELEALSHEFPGKRIMVRRGEANAEIRALSTLDWSHRRAVLFLDPYGLQVEWATIEAIARTEAIDLWMLFPLGIGVNRMLPRSGEMPESWVRRLDLLLGTSDWIEEFYQIQDSGQGDLFGHETQQVIKASTEVIGRYFIERLRATFPGVVDKPGVLRNSSNCPLYLLCFAASNEAGADIACGIAEHLLKGLR